LDANECWPFVRSHFAQELQLMTLFTQRSIRIRIATRLAITGVLLAGLLVKPQSAEAQSKFSVLRLQPAASPYSWYFTEAARLQRHLSPSFGLLVHYDHRPLQVNSNFTGDRLYDEVGYQVNAEILAAIGFFDWVEIGINLPVSFAQGAGDRNTGLPQKPDLSAGLGDLRLITKIRLFHVESFKVALMVGLSLPTGKNSDYLGDDGVGLEPRLLAQLDVGRVGVGFNVGARLRPDQSFTFAGGNQNVEIQNELFFSMGVRLWLVKNKLEALVDAHGIFQLGEGDDEERSGELLGGLRYKLPKGFGIELAAGPGFGKGVGTPSFRIIGGVRWMYAPPQDPDKDGLKGKDDKCPMKPEDKDGFEDSDGCPDLDNDKDGIPDKDDKCPMKPEDKDGFEDGDGCPDLDNDKDGIPDKDDKCPMKPEDKDGFEDKDGCPDLDNDKDGIPDKKDKCPMKPEDKDGFQDGDGCPDLDNDGDGIPDLKDKCPSLPEVVNGVDDEDGCPDKAKGPVKIQRGKVTAPPVYFATGKDRILKRSFSVLELVAKTLNDNKWVKKVRIEGHTDSRGRAKRNMRLSKRRAQSVMRFLIEKGVDASRLEAQGFGEDKPIASNRTRKGRAKNRRVEFVIVDPPLDKNKTNPDAQKTNP
jgi:outer membrane protein OmpA-like peptidoglycan-associated protein